MSVFQCLSHAGEQHGRWSVCKSLLSQKTAQYFVETIISKWGGVILKAETRLLFISWIGPPCVLQHYQQGLKFSGTLPDSRWRVFYGQHCSHLFFHDFSASVFLN